MRYSADGCLVCVLRQSVHVVSVATAASPASVYVSRIVTISPSSPLHSDSTTPSAVNSMHSCLGLGSCAPPLQPPLVYTRLYESNLSPPRCSIIFSTFQLQIQADPSAISFSIAGGSGGDTLDVCSVFTGSPSWCARDGDAAQTHPDPLCRQIGWTALSMALYVSSLISCGIYSVKCGVLANIIHLTPVIQSCHVVL
jgi:hypothetical protein